MLRSLAFHHLYSSIALASALVLGSGCGAKFSNEPQTVTFNSSFLAPVKIGETSNVKNPTVAGAVPDVTSGKIQFFSDSECTLSVGEGTITDGAYSTQIGPFTESGKIQPYIKVTAPDPSSGKNVTTACMQMDSFYVLDLTIPKDKTPPPNATDWTISPGLGTLTRVAIPVFTAKSLEDGSVVRVFDGGCSLRVGEGIVSGGTVTVLTTNPLIRSGSRMFYTNAIDKAGNVSECVSTGTTYIFDGTLPTITVGSWSNAAVGSGSTPYIDLTYADDYAMNTISLVAGNITLNYGGTVANCSAAVSTPSDNVRRITVSGCTGDGDMTFSVVAETSVDLAGNKALAVSTSPTLTWDNTAPTNTLGAWSTSGPILAGATPTLDITYSSDATISLVAGNITINTTGTVANCSVAVSSPSTSVRLATLSGCTGTGNVTLSIAASTGVDAAGNVSLAAGPSGAVSVDTVAPNAPTFSMTPTSGGTSANPNPVLSGTGDENGAVIRLYADAACATEKTNVTVAAGVFTAAAIPVSGDGLKTFYYKIADTAGNSTACATTGKSFTYQTDPIISLSRSFYSFTEAGAQIGTSVTVSRDVDGIASSVTLTWSQVTARDGTHFAAGSQTVSFTSSEFTKTISVGTFGIIDNATTDGDRYFSLKISSPSGGVLGTTVTAQANIIDEELAGDYFLGHSLFSVAENGSNVTLTVQRLNAASYAGSVDVSFAAGSAAATTDYTATTQTVSFAQNTDEATITVAIVDNATVQDNRSFYAKLTSPSGTTQVRAQSISKIRILDNDDTTTCSTSGSPFGGGDGLSAATAYRICTLTQMKQVTNYLTSYFRLMADIELDATMVPIATNFTGTFNGDERILSRFSADGANAGVALFISTYGTSNGSQSIHALNFMDYQIINAGQYSGSIVGFSGRSTGYASRLKDLHASGYLHSTTGSYIGGIVGAYQNIRTSGSGDIAELTRILSSGYLTGDGYYSGGISGYFYNSVTSPTYTTSSLYNTMSVLNAGTYSYPEVGGIFGRLYDHIATSNMSLSDIDNRGYLKLLNSRSRVAGFIGMYTTDYTTPTLTIVNSKNYGTITSSGGSNVAGFISQVSTDSPVTLGSAGGPIANYGTISGGTYVAGIVGLYTFSTSNQTHAIRYATNAGTISGTSNYTAGIVSRINPIDLTNSTLIVSNCTNTGSVSNTTGSAGGIVGVLSLGGAPNTGSGNSITLDSNTNSGAISGGNTSNGNAGGIVTSVSFTAAGGNNTITVSNSTNSGTISGKQNVGGLIGILDQPAGNGASAVSLSSLTNSGTVTCVAANCGGILGSGTNLSSGTITSLTNQSSGTLSGLSYVGGLIGNFTTGTSSATTFSSSSNAASVTGTSTYVGGLVGYWTSGTSSTDTFTSLSNTNTGVVSGATYVSGGIGYYNQGISGTASWTTLSNAASITNTGTSTGGIVGYLISKASSSFTGTSLSNTGAVSGTNHSSGLIGIAGSTSGTSNYSITLNNSSNSGTITGSGADAGGCIGILATAGVSTNVTATITNCQNSGSIQALNYAGGILGDSSIQGTGGGNIVTVQNSGNTGTVTATGGYAGGIVGRFQHSSTGLVQDKVLTCTNSGAISSGTASYAGGMVGSFDGDASTTLQITSSTNSGTVSGDNGVGGIIGYANLTGDSSSVTLTSVSNSASGTVTSTGNYSGGIVGYGYHNATNSTFTVTKATNAASITGVTSVSGIFGGFVPRTATSGLVLTYSSNTGAIAGSKASGIITWVGAATATTAVDIRDCYNQGNISGASGAGIFFGYTIVAGTSGTISRVYSTGSITSTTKYSGVYNIAALTLADVFWLRDAGGTNSGVSDTLGTEVTTANMKLQATFTNFDFGLAPGIWNIPNGTNPVYPTLK